MSNWIRRSLYTVILLCCVIIGMRVYLELQTTPDGTGTVSAASIPELLPEFTLNNIWGEPTPITKWSGKPLLINFWATWCAPCRREMPLLQALHANQEELQVIGIAIDRQPDVQTYLAEAGISYPNLVGEADAMAVSDLFGLDGLGLPFTVLVGKKGEILTVYIGELDAEQLGEMAHISKAFDMGRTELTTARQRLRDL